MRSSSRSAALHACVLMVLGSNGLIALADGPGGDDGGRGLDVCPAIRTDTANCHSFDVAAGGIQSDAIAGGVLTADNVVPASDHPTRLCWAGLYYDRVDPPAPDEVFRVRIFGDSAGLPDLAGGPIFERLFRQSGQAGVNRLEMSCLDGQPCPGAPFPIWTNGHWIYSAEVAEGLPMVAGGCYWVEIGCVASAQLGRGWYWLGSSTGADFASMRAENGAYTAYTQVMFDRTMCLSGGVASQWSGCVAPPIPPLCTSPPENGHAWDGATDMGFRSSAPGSIGRPPGQPHAWEPAQFAENFQVGAAAAITNVCFQGFWLDPCGTHGPYAPRPDQIIEYYADLEEVPGGPVPIASFAIGVTPGVTYLSDMVDLVSVWHPPVEVAPGRCYWLSVSRVQGDADGCGAMWHWRLTTTSSAGSDGVLAWRRLPGGDAEPWAEFEVNIEGSNAVSNFVYLLNAGPVVAPTCEADATDCNGNGVADADEIAANAALDCFDRAAGPQAGFYVMGGADGILDACQCAGDFNRVGGVGSTDISAFLNTWLRDVAQGQARADFDCSGTTNSSDISAMLTRWLLNVAGEPAYGGCP